MVVRKTGETADEMRFERKLRIGEGRSVGDRSMRLNRGPERILIARQHNNVEREYAAGEALRERQNGEAPIRVHGSCDLALLAPGGAEADVYDEENADVQTEGHLRFEIGAAAARQGRVSQALDGALGFDRDRDGDQPAD